MCICCCCCNLCNSFSSRCIEISILVLSLCTLIVSLLEIIIIKWNHLDTSTFILLMILVLFSAIITFNSSLILIYRLQRVINKKRNSISLCFARIGFLLTIPTFVISIIAESMIQTNFKNINYPCKNMNNNNNNEDYDYGNTRMLSDNTYNDFCKDKNSNYNLKICSDLEYSISYISCTVTELCTLILIFLWFNDLRRIKEKVEGILPIYDTTYINQDNYNFGINEPQANGIDSANRNINQNNSGQSQVVLIRNNKSRLSQPINISFKNSNQNYISYLRQEIKNGIESIDEEDDTSENKDNNDFNNNKKDENLKISIYNTHSNDKKRDGDILKANEKKINNEDKNIEEEKNESEKNNNDINNTKVEENKEKEIEISNIYSNK